MIAADTCSLVACLQGAQLDSIHMQKPRTMAGLERESFFKETINSHRWGG